MDDKNKTNARLIAELEELRKMNAEFETNEKELIKVINGLEKAETEFKRSNKSLRESEERYHIIYSNSAVSFWEFDITNVMQYLEKLKSDGISDLLSYLKENPEVATKILSSQKLLDVNDATLKMYGAKTKEELFAAYGKHTTPESMNSFIEFVIACMEGDEYLERETINHTLDGRYINLLLRVSFPEIYQKKRLLIAAVDITERKKAEEKLRKTQLLLESSIESPKDMIIFAINKDYQYLFFNKPHKKVMVYAYGKHVTIGMNLLDCISDEEDRKKAKVNFDRALSGKSHTTIEEYGDVERNYYETLYNPIMNQENEIIGATAFAQDITERKKTELELIESEKRFRSLVETAQELIWKCDIEGKFTYLNPAWEKSLGYKIEEMLGRPFSDFQTPEVFERDLKEFSRHLEGGFVKGYETTYIDKSGKLINLVFNAIPLKDSQGNIIGTQGTAFDITEQKKAAEEKAKLEEQYRQSQKVESIGRLAGGMAHDLNNLLVPIIGYAEMLMDDFDPGDERRESADEILRAGFRARDLVQQLLAFSRKQFLHYKTLNINQVIEGFEKLLRRTIREDIGIEFIPSPDIQTIWADIGQIEQVIMNLCVNAQDAMPEGGKLILETAMVDLDESYAANNPDAEPGEYVMLVVSDTGCGMDEDIREQIFEPFFSTKGKLGTGMGLATVYGIVKQHGGNIRVYSEPGKGTTFKIYLPLSEKEHVEKNTGKKSDGDLSGSETIMLAEDNEEVRHLSRAILKKHGYTVLVAEDGAEALTVLEAHHGPVHLLLTDVVMPGMNGGDLYAKAADKRPDLKVLFMSGYTDDIIANHGVVDDGIPFIQKPFSSQALAAKVREALEQD